ncbi:hypothetical protein INR49_025771 [Caranx melampygus]|nr:hypothetical protein INR49_025771 [Caranx melampygus]
MQFLFIAALLVSAVAAHPDSGRPWQDEKFPPAGGPKLDADPNCRDREQSVARFPEDGNAGSGGDRTEGYSGHPVRPRDVLPWLQITPSAEPENGNQQPGDMTNQDLMKRLPTWGKREAPGFGLRRKRARGPNMRNPGVRGNIVFSPVFTVDSVTFQNITAVPLKEVNSVIWGSVFMIPKQYVKLIYNATEPNKVSIEYGVVKPMSLGALVGIQDDPEEADL